MGLAGFMMIILLTRGPHEDRYTWLGYSNGLRPFRIASAGKEQPGDAEKNMDMKTNDNVEKDSKTEPE